MPAKRGPFDVARSKPAPKGRKPAPKGRKATPKAKPAPKGRKATPKAKPAPKGLQGALPGLPAPVRAAQARKALGDYYRAKSEKSRERLALAYEKVRRSLADRLRGAFPQLGAKERARWLDSASVSWLLDRTHTARSRGRPLPVYSPVKAAKGKLFRGPDGRIRNLTYVLTALKRHKYEGQVRHLQSVLEVSYREAQGYWRDLKAAHGKNFDTATRSYVDASGNVFVVGGSPGKKKGRPSIMSI